MITNTTVVLDQVPNATVSITMPNNTVDITIAADGTISVLTSSPQQITVAPFPINKQMGSLIMAALF